MPTFGFRFRPWDDKRAIAEGPAILRYLRETAEEHGVDRLIRFGCKVLRASWRSDEARWILEVRGPEGTSREIAADFLYACTGYYEYERGYMPGWPGMERFAGRIVHPQEWPEGLAYEGAIDPGLRLLFKHDMKRQGEMLMAGPCHVNDSAHPFGG